MRVHLKVVPAAGQVQRKGDVQILSKGFAVAELPEHGAGQGHVAFQVRVVGVLDHLIVEQAGRAGGGNSARPSIRMQPG